MNKLKVLPDAMREKLANEIKMMLHACRDCLRNRGVDTKRVPFSVNDGYYGEAFGIIRGLSVMGYGTCSGPVNKDVPGNLRFWFHNLEREVLAEENFDGNHECDHCLERYRKDTAGRVRPY